MLDHGSFYKKLKKGRPDYYIRQIQRVDGRPKVVSQIYLGSVEKMAGRFRQAEQGQKTLATELAVVRGWLEI